MINHGVQCADGGDGLSGRVALFNPLVSSSHQLLTLVPPTATMLEPGTWAEVRQIWVHAAVWMIRFYHCLCHLNAFVLLLACMPRESCTTF